MAASLSNRDLGPSATEGRSPGPRPVGPFAAGDRGVSRLKRPDLPLHPKKGRGAASNDAGRFEAYRTEQVDDGWTQGMVADTEAIPTTVTEETAKSLITYNQSPDLNFDRSINPYRGCEHGCVYCFARPSHAYLGLSAGLDFETRLFAKVNAGKLLREELAAKSYRPAPIALGANTDPYQPVEKRYGITRQILEVLDTTRHPAGIVTKSTLVTRDLDILERMAADRLMTVAISVTTLNPDLCRRLEPRAPTPARRLETIRRLAAAGVPVGVLAAPMIPGLNDHEAEAILAAAAEAGATKAGYVLLRLPLELDGLFEEWLNVHAPDRAKRVLARVSDMRRGRRYVSAFGERQRGHGPLADLLERRFELARKRHGLARKGWGLDSTLFEPPRSQLSLF